MVTVVMDAADSCYADMTRPDPISSEVDPCSGVQGHSSSSSSPCSSSSRPKLSFSINQILGREPETADREPSNRDGHGPEEEHLPHSELYHSNLATDATHSSSSSSTTDDHLMHHHSRRSCNNSDATSLRPLPSHSPHEMLLPQSRFLYRPLGVLMGRGGGVGGGDGQHAIHPLHHYQGQPVSPAASAAAAAMFPWMFERKDRITVVRRVGHPYQNRTPPKRKKPRTSFTRTQIVELEKRFHRQKYLASAERSSLAKTLGMSDAQVKTWFQNRRTKWRRQTAEEREAERQAAHRLLLSLHGPSGRPVDPSSPSSSSYSPSSPSLYNSPPDPLCMNNASLQALHNLQPWADDYPPQHPHHHPPATRISTSSTGCSIITSPYHPPAIPHHHHQLLHHHHHHLHRSLHPPPSISAAAAAYLSNMSSTPVQ